VPEETKVPFLDRMVAASTERARLLRGRADTRELRARCADLPTAPALQLSPTGFDLIAEIKRRSPSEGALTDGVSVTEQAHLYEDSGAAAVSVLTEPAAFSGRLEDLQAAASAVRVPVMRKDFLVDPAQVLEARAAGGGGVLLIVAILGEARLGEMLGAVAETGMFALIEAFDAEDLERAGRAAATGEALGARCLVGLNARDLRTLRVDPDRIACLAGQLPPSAHGVAESGLRSPEDAAAVAGLGYDAALVGTALMRAREPGHLIEAMLVAGRNRKAAECTSP
jgi:indole-3-glycerol phosphate synthase